MAFYMIQVAYNTDGWKGLIANPQDRIEAIKPAVEQLDGTVVSGWLAFGEYDVVAIVELPTNVSAAAFSMAVSATASFIIPTFSERRHSLLFKGESGRR